MRLWDFDSLLAHDHGATAATTGGTADDEAELAPSGARSPRYEDAGYEGMPSPDGEVGFGDDESPVDYDQNYSAAESHEQLGFVAAR